MGGRGEREGRHHLDGLLHGDGGRRGGGLQGQGLCQRESNSEVRFTQESANTAIPPSYFLAVAPASQALSIDFAILSYIHLWTVVTPFRVF